METTTDNLIDAYAHFVTDRYDAAANAAGRQRRDPATASSLEPRGKAALTVAVSAVDQLPVLVVLT
nr:hypothetical protein [Rhodococcus sp. (in: high G+C Gram-positive bacteria)]